MSNITRRSFLQRGAAAAAALTIVPGSVLGKSHGYVAPTDKLNIAAVGIGGMGHANINAVKEVKTSLLFATWIGNMRKAYSTNIRMLKILGLSQDVR